MRGHVPMHLAAFIGERGEFDSRWEMDRQLGRVGTAGGWGVLGSDALSVGGSDLRGHGRCGAVRSGSWGTSSSWRRFVSRYISRLLSGLDFIPEPCLDY